MRIWAGRTLNPRTLMWEFADRSGVAIADELMPQPGTPGQALALIEAKDRISNSASAQVPAHTKGEKA
jgi:hypothetical protein